MGCSPSIQFDEELEIIQSERRMLSTQYTVFCSHCQPFQFQKRFSQGICITDMKKESLFLTKPSQTVDDDPIFQLESQYDSSLMVQSSNQSHSSRGILKSPKDINGPQKKVRFQQEVSNVRSQNAKMHKKKISKKSIFMS